MTKTTKKRQPPSVERQFALALVALIEAGAKTQGNSEYELGFRQACAAAETLLKTNGYEGLESIPTRVARIQGEIEKALETKNYDALPRLGQEMKRAEAGKPPLATEKKPRKKKVEPATATTDPPAEKKKRGGKKGEPDLPEDGVPCKCGNVDCDWKGIAVIGSACPVDGYLVVAQEG